MTQSDKRYYLTKKYNFEDLGQNDIFDIHKRFNPKDKAIVGLTGDYTADELLEYYIKLQNKDLNLDTQIEDSLWPTVENKFSIKNHSLVLNGSYKGDSLVHCLRGCKLFTKGYKMRACKYIWAALPNAWGELLAKSNYFDVRAGIFPETEKDNKLVAIPKLSSKNLSDISSRRLLTVPSVYSSMRGKWVSKLLLDFLEKNEILPDNQYGFRAKRSTSLLFHDLWYQLGQIPAHKYKAIIGLDLANAFGSPTHDLLKNRLSKICDTETLAYFSDELDNRHAAVVEKCIYSKKVKLNARGLGQGAASSPVIFISYLSNINQISENLHNVNILLFADDIISVIHGNSRKEVQETASVFMKQTAKYLEARGLKLSISKTSYMAVGESDNIPLKINDEVIECISKIKHLGLRFNSEIDVTPQINFLQHKFHKHLHLIHNILLSGTTKDLRKLAFLLVYGNLSYCFDSFPLLKNADYNKLAKSISRIIKLLLKIPSYNVSKKNVSYAYLFNRIGWPHPKNLHRKAILTVFNNILLNGCPNKMHQIVFNGFKTSISKRKIILPYLANFEQLRDFYEKIIDNEIIFEIPCVNLKFKDHGFNKYLMSYPCTIKYYLERMNLIK